MPTKHEALDVVDIIDALIDSPNPVIRYKLKRYVLGEDAASAAMQRLRASIKRSAIAQGLIEDLKSSDPTDRSGLSAIYLTLRYLADIDYPPGDRSLIPYRDTVYAWLQRLEAEYDTTLLIRGKHRVHGSFHANAIYASIVLGLANRATDALAANLLRYEWPGGGWNCSKVPRAKGPSIVHTAYGLRGLITYRDRQPGEALTGAIERATEVVLERRVFLKRSTGVALRPVYAKPSYPYPRLYDFMAGLHILARAGRVDDPRCADALDLLETKLITGEGVRAERQLYSHKPGSDNFTRAEWGRDKSGRASPYLTVDALEILKAAGRLDLA